jgi:hypothetical protein
MIAEKKVNDETPLDGLSSLGHVYEFCKIC